MHEYFAIKLESKFEWSNLRDERLRRGHNLMFKGTGKERGKVEMKKVRNEGPFIEDYLDLVHDESDPKYLLLVALYPFITGEHNLHDLQLIANTSVKTIIEMVKAHNSVIIKLVI